MPSSRCNHIPIIISIVRQLEPRSILDVGVGFGKWGHLFREYTDIVMAESDPARYQRENWQIRIDGIEGCEPYITPMHRYVYDELLIGDMREKIHAVGNYDLVFLGDVIEHVAKNDGVALLQACLAHADKAVVITTPGTDAPQDAACDNPLEVHRSFWTPDDFCALGRCALKLDENDTLIGVLLKDGIKAPLCEPQLRSSVKRRSSFWRRVKRRLELTADCLP